MDPSALQTALIPLAPSSTLILDQVDELATTHLHRLLILTLSDGSRIIMKLGPKHSTRLLRHEQRSIAADACTLQLLKLTPNVPIPWLLKADTAGKSLGLPYLLMAPVSGWVLEDIQPHLQDDEVGYIDRQLGSFVAAIASNTSPTGKFGSVLDIEAKGGSASWKETFFRMVEASLRDAEDMVISIPYSVIRQQLRRHHRVLEDVKRAQLVIPALGLPNNVVVCPETKKICGILDFTGALWGDVLMSELLAGGSGAVLEGYYAGSPFYLTTSQRIRSLLYTCYRSIVAIAKFYYRPRSDNSELDARRTLTRTLALLASE
ncbi:MAG: hypothetical protein M1829_000945 [Trizodia sp. TS-e1964]|nr:MAG: hypothetical protein M1829_000945 [Trizodia sp. TS-e1964]